MKIPIQIITARSERHRAVCPSLPGCYADAATPEAAVESLRRSVESYLCSLNAAVSAELELVHAVDTRRNLLENHHVTQPS